MPLGSSLVRGNGQMHRLTFDPQYNGTTNRTIYGATSNGGLWRTEDDGENWNVVNTDHQLPFTNVSGIAVDYNNSNNLFICTGMSDAGIEYLYTPNSGDVNPIFTTGIYRSTNYGETWEPINDNFLLNFINGGTTRKIMTHPQNSDKVYVLTSYGIFISNNALSLNPTWVQPQIQPTLPPANLPDEFLRGLEFKPGNPDVMYSSGQDIYQSTDGGNTWISITGTNTGLDFSSIPFLNNIGITVERINLAVPLPTPTGCTLT